MTYGVRPTSPNPSRMAYARGGARLIAQLEDRDLLGAVMFDTETSVVNAAHAAERTAAHASTISSAAFVPSGGTDFKDASRSRAAADRERHVRQTHHPARDGASIRPAAEHDQLIAALARSGITVTSIRIGDDRDSYAPVKQIRRRPAAVPTCHRRRVAAEPDDRGRARARGARRTNPTDAFHPRHGGRARRRGLRERDLPVPCARWRAPLKSGATAWLTGDRAGKAARSSRDGRTGWPSVAVFTANPGTEWQSWGQVRRFWSQLVRWFACPQSATRCGLVRQDGAAPIPSIDTYDSVRTGSLTLKITGRDGTVRELAPPARRAAPRGELPPLDTIEPRVLIEKRRGRELVCSREEWLPAATGDAQVGSEDAEASPTGRCRSLDRGDHRRRGGRALDGDPEARRASGRRPSQLRPHAARSRPRAGARRHRHPPVGVRAPVA